MMTGGVAKKRELKEEIDSDFEVGIISISLLPD